MCIHTFVLIEREDMHTIMSKDKTLPIGKDTYTNWMDNKWSLNLFTQNFYVL